MAVEKIYADLIRKGFKTIEEVPENLKVKVEAILRSDVDA